MKACFYDILEVLKYSLQDFRNIIETCLHLPLPLISVRACPRSESPSVSEKLEATEEYKNVKECQRAERGVCLIIKEGKDDKQ